MNALAEQPYLLTPFPHQPQKKIGGILTYNVFATTYYVRTDGSNSNAGTTNSSGGAWLTHVYAFAHVTAGDSIVTNPGTYNESGQLTLPAGVSWHGLDSSSTIIKSTLTTFYYEMVNMRSAEGTNGNQSISGLKFDGQGTTFSLFRVGGRNNVSIHDCSFVNPQIYGVTFAVHNTDDFDPGYPAAYATGNSFYNNVMWNCGNWDASGGNGYGALQIGGQKDFQIYNNRIIQQNTPYNNGWPIKYWQGGYNIGTKIHDNYLKAWLQTFTLGDLNWDFAIEMFNCTGMEIYNNNIINGCVDFNYSSSTGFNTGGSKLVGGYGYSLWVHNNTFSCQSVPVHIQTGITLEFSDDSVLIENNTFDKFNIGVLFTARNGDSMYNITVRKNLFTNVAGADGEGYFVDMGTYSGNNIKFRNFNLYNNTFLSYAGTPPPFGIKLPNSTSGGYFRNFNINNNIMKGVSDAVLYVHEGSVAVDTLNMTYNDLYANGNGDTLKRNGSAPRPTHFTFSNNYNVNPSFGATGYKLVAGTTLVEAGTNVGLPYIGSAPSINWTDTTSPAPPVYCNTYDADYLGPFMTLSNSDKTVRKAQYPDATALTVASSSSGKKCWVVIIDSLNPADLYNFSVGVATHSASLSSMIGDDNYGWSLRTDGLMRHNGYFNGTWTNSYGQGDTLLLALDLSGVGTDSLKYYKRTAGVWVKMPQTFAMTAGTYYPGVGAYQVGFKATMNLAPTDTILGYSPICSTAPHLNYSPVAHAGVDQLVTTSTATLSGSGTDADGYVTAYLWTKISGPTGGTITSSTSASTGIASLVSGIYKYQLRVTDDSSATAVDTVQITMNTPPVANSGGNQSIEPSSATLSGSGTDADGTIVAYAWRQISGPNTPTLSGTTTATLIVSGMIAGSYLYELKVTDNQGATNTNNALITVSATSPGRYVETNRAKF